jgi:hypothetical protein
MEAPLSNQISIWAHVSGPVKTKYKWPDPIHLPYGYFTLNIKDKRPSGSLPLNVRLNEQPFPRVTKGSVSLGGGTAVLLDEKINVRDGRNSISPGYYVDGVKNFQMKYPFIRFKVRTKQQAHQVNNFKGSTLTIIVSNSSGLTVTKQIKILYGNPNNHYHWRNEDKFVDGWFFKCVHIDNSSKKATSFFFLYGVNRNKGTNHEKGFVYCGKGGSIQLRPDLLAAAPGAVPSAYDLVDHETSFAAFKGEKYLRLNSRIGQDLIATDMGCKGKLNAGTGNEVSWDLNIIKFHNQVVTDYNPLPGSKGQKKTPGHPLWVFVDPNTINIGRPLALYMSQSMNCLVSGTINWKGTAYNLNNHKAYQDENWGSGGFPHPYVWLQANNFRMGSSELPSTSLVALFTTEMPLDWAPNPTIGGILLRHNNQIYRFLHISGGGAGTIADITYDVGPMSCKVELKQGGATRTVDMSVSGDVQNKLQSFDIRKNDQSKWVYPVKFILEAENDADKIKVVFNCQQNSVYRLKAPLNGQMVPGVTKQSTQAQATVELTTKSGSTYTFRSDFASADFGD